LAVEVLGYVRSAGVCLASHEVDNHLVSLPRVECLSENRSN
jgi:hypothetical protein